MRWPGWPFAARNRAADSDRPDPAVPAASGELAPARAAGEWRSVAPIRPVVQRTELTAPSVAFSGAVMDATALPPILAPLAHPAGSTAPRGLVSGLATAIEPRDERPPLPDLASLSTDERRSRMPDTVVAPGAGTTVPAAAPLRTLSVVEDDRVESARSLTAIDRESAALADPTRAAASAHSPAAASASSVGPTSVLNVENAGAAKLNGEAAPRVGDAGSAPGSAVPGPSERPLAAATPTGADSMPEHAGPPAEHGARTIVRRGLGMPLSELPPTRPLLGTEAIDVRTRPAAAAPVPGPGATPLPPLRGGQPQPLPRVAAVQRETVVEANAPAAGDAAAATAPALAPMPVTEPVAAWGPAPEPETRRPDDTSSAPPETAAAASDLGPAAIHLHPRGVQDESIQPVLAPGAASPRPAPLQRSVAASPPTSASVPAAPIVSARPSHTAAAAPSVPPDRPGSQREVVPAASAPLAAAAGVPDGPAPSGPTGRIVAATPSARHAVPVLRTTAATPMRSAMTAMMPSPIVAATPATVAPVHVQRSLRSAGADLPLAASAPAPAPASGAASAQQPLPVQRVVSVGEIESVVEAAPGAGAATEAAGRAAGGGGIDPSSLDQGQLDLLARRLYGPIRDRIARELLLDRERAGLLADR